MRPFPLLAACPAGFTPYISVNVASLPAPCDTRHEGAPAAYSRRGFDCLVGDYLVHLHGHLPACDPLGVCSRASLLPLVEIEHQLAHETHELGACSGMRHVRGNPVRALRHLVDDGQPAREELAVNQAFRKPLSAAEPNPLP